MFDQKYNLIDSDGEIIETDLFYTEAEYHQQFNRGSEIVSQTEEEYWNE